MINFRLNYRHNIEMYMYLTLVWNNEICFCIECFKNNDEQTDFCSISNKNEYTAWQNLLSEFNKILTTSW